MSGKNDNTAGVATNEHDSSLSAEELEELSRLSAGTLVDVKRLQRVAPGDRENAEGHVYVLLASPPSLPPAMPFPAIADETSEDKEKREAFERRQYLEDSARTMLRRRGDGE